MHMVWRKKRALGKAARGHFMSQYCTDAQAGGAGITISPISVKIPQLYLTFHMLHKWLPLAFPRNVRCVSALLSSGHVPSSSGCIFTLLYWNTTHIVWIITCSHPQQEHFWLETCEIILVACKKGLASFWGEKQLEDWRNYMSWAVKVDTKGGNCRNATLPQNDFRLADK